MTDGTLPLTLREWRRLVTAPRTVAALAGTGLVLGLSGPFDTFSAMPPGARIVYWMVMTFATFGIGMLTTRVLAATPPLQRLGIWPSHVVSAAFGGLPVTAAVLLINRLSGVQFADSLRDVVILLLYCSVICICVTSLALAFIWTERDGSVNATKAAPLLLKRLPVAKRGALSHLSMQDHYVHVFTSGGDELVLMRLADAITETQPVAGLRIHRSHWVALDAVARTRRKGDRHFVEMTDGTVLPISRSSIPAARQAGLLAHSGP